MVDRLRVCVACENPSPGPSKRLYYHPRKHGPFFPILGKLKTEENTSLFLGGRTIVCMSCASHLQRQWMLYEKSWTPLERRTFKLLSAERSEKFNTGRSSTVGTTSPEEQGTGAHENQSTKWKKTFTKINTQRKLIYALEKPDHGTDRLTNSNAGPADKHVNGVSGRFRKASQKVQDMNSRPAAQLQTVVERMQELETSGTEEEEEASESSREERDRENCQAFPKIREVEITERVEKRLKDSAEILIRKMAEIQYEENLRQSQETIRSALERVGKTQDRPRFVKSVGKQLRARLYQDLEFRSATAPLTAPQVPSQALVQADHGNVRHQEILQELSKEQEWRRKTDAVMMEQERKIENLRKDLKDEIQHILEMQTKQFEDVKRLIDRSSYMARRSPSDQAYVSLDASAQSSSNRGDMETKRHRARRPEGWETDEHRSRSSTPGFYIQ